MIEINLLPEELKAGIKKAKKEASYMVALNLLPLAFGAVILINICLFLAGFVRFYQSGMLSRKWRGLEHQRRIVEKFKLEYTGLSGDSAIMQRLINQRLNCAEKLNKLSLQLPRGIWFNELAIAPKELVLKGSVISFEKEELNLLSKFIDSLKKDTGFFNGLASLELSSVARKTISGYDIVDFIIIGTFKPNP